MSGAVLLLALAAGPASAGVSGDVSIASDDRYRGRTVSEGRPVASLALSYDTASGLYAGGQATAVAARGEGVRFLSGEAFVGYARRLSAETSIDIGGKHTEYSEYYLGQGDGVGYSEAYVGLITRRFSTHVFYSPNYFGRGVGTFYSEVESAAHPARNWSVTGHVGMLNVVSGRLPTGYRSTQFDWRLGVARALGAFELQLAWSGAGPNREYYEGQTRGSQGVVFAVSRSF